MCMASLKAAHRTARRTVRITHVGTPDMSTTKQDSARVGCGRLVRRLALVRGHDRYGRLILVSLHETAPEIPAGMWVVESQARYAANGNVRWWDVLSPNNVI